MAAQLEYQVPDEIGLYLWTNSGGEPYTVVTRLGTAFSVSPGRQFSVWVRGVDDVRDGIQCTMIGDPLPEWWGDE